jgi:hypothetical protein
VRLSPLAKGAVLVALIGGAFWVWGASKEVDWARGGGAIVFIGGALVYYFERFRMIKRRRNER